MDPITMIRNGLKALLAMMGAGVRIRITVDIDTRQP